MASSIVELASDFRLDAVGGSRLEERERPRLFRPSSVTAEIASAADADALVLEVSCLAAIVVQIKHNTQSYHLWLRLSAICFFRSNPWPTCNGAACFRSTQALSR